MWDIFFVDSFVLEKEKEEKACSFILSPNISREYKLITI